MRAIIRSLSVPDLDEPEWHRRPDGTIGVKVRDPFCVRIEIESSGPVTQAELDQLGNLFESTRFVDVEVRPAS